MRYTFRTLHVLQSGGKAVFWRHSVSVWLIHLSCGCGWCLLWGTGYGSYPGMSTTPSVGARHTARTDTWLSYAPSEPTKRQAEPYEMQAQGEQLVLGCPVSTSTYLDMEVSTDSEDG